MTYKSVIKSLYRGGRVGLIVDQSIIERECARYRISVPMGDLSFGEFTVYDDVKYDAY